MAIAHRQDQARKEREVSRKGSPTAAVRWDAAAAAAAAAAATTAATTAAAAATAAPLHLHKPVAVIYPRR